MTPYRPGRRRGVGRPAGCGTDRGGAASPAGSRVRRHRRAGDAGGGLRGVVPHRGAVGHGSGGGRSSPAAACPYRAQRLTARLIAEKPAVFVGIDAPDFNLRLASRAARRRHPRRCSTSAPACGPGARVGCGCCATPATAYCACCRSKRPFSKPAACRRDLRRPPVRGADPGTSPIPAQRGGRLASARRRSSGCCRAAAWARSTRLGPVFLQAAARLQRDVPGLGFAAPHGDSGGPPRFRAPDRGTRARPRRCTSWTVARARSSPPATSCCVGLRHRYARGHARRRPMVVAYRVAPLTYWAARRAQLVKVPFLAAQSARGRGTGSGISPGRGDAANVSPHSVGELLRSPQTPGGSASAVRRTRTAACAAARATSRPALCWRWPGWLPASQSAARSSL